MGCNSSKPLDIRTAEVNMSPEAKEFLRFVNLDDAIAVAMQRQWISFCEKQEKEELKKKPRPLVYKRGQDKKVWATDSQSPTSNQHVNDIGNLWLQYIRYDLLKHGWGGDCEYKVEGSTGEGVIHISAEVHTNTESISSSFFAVDLHYHIDVASPNRAGSPKAPGSPRAKVI